MAVFYDLINSMKYSPLTANNFCLKLSFLLKLIHSIASPKSLDSPNQSYENNIWEPDMNFYYITIQ